MLGPKSFVGNRVPRGVNRVRAGILREGGYSPLAEEHNIDHLPMTEADSIHGRFRGQGFHAVVRQAIPDRVREHPAVVDA
jgi:hypothetical protein